MKKRKEAGRPPGLTLQIVEQVELLIPQSYYLDAVYSYLGIAKVTFYRWVKYGREISDKREKNAKAKIRQDDELYLRLWNAIKKGRGELTIRAFSAIQNHGANQWQANAWILERLQPEKFGMNRNVVADLLKTVEKLTGKVEELQAKLGVPDVAKTAPETPAGATADGDGRPAPGGRGGDAGSADDGSPGPAVDAERRPADSGGGVPGG